MHKCVIETSKDVSYTKNILALLDLGAKGHLFFLLDNFAFSWSHTAKQKKTHNSGRVFTENSVKIFFFCFQLKTSVWVLAKVLLMSTHNKSFHVEIRKIILGRIKPTPLQPLTKNVF